MHIVVTHPKHANMGNIAPMTTTPPSRLTKAQLKEQLDQLQAEREQLAKANADLKAKVSAARDTELVFMSTRIPRDLRERAKDLGRKFDLSLQEVVRTALEEWVQEKETELDQD